MSMRQLKYLKLNKIKNNIKIALACAKVLSSLCIIISFSLYFLPWNKNFQNTYWLLTNIFYFQTIDYIYTIFPILSLPSIISLGIFAWKKVSFWAEYLFFFFFYLSLVRTMISTTVRFQKEDHFFKLLTTHDTLVIKFPNI